MQIIRQGTNLGRNANHETESKFGPRMRADLFQIFANLQCTVVGGGDKAPLVIRTDLSKFEFFGSFWVYIEQKRISKHF